MTKQEAIDNLLKGARASGSSLLTVSRDQLLIALGDQPDTEEVSSDNTDNSEQ